MKIKGIGSAIPEKFISNEQTEQLLGLEHGWALRRTGVRFRPCASPEEATSDLAVKAGQKAINDAGLDPEDIKLLILATSTPDYPLPPTAPEVAYRLGLKHAGAFDLAAACAGFLYALAMGEAYGKWLNEPILVIASNVLSKRTNPNDPSTVTLFADGAGAVVLTPGESFLGTYLGADGSRYDKILIKAGGSRNPISTEAIRQGLHFMQMQSGLELFRQAVRMMTYASKKAVESAGINISQIDLWIPHQANKRIIQETGRFLGIPPERTVCILENYGNSSAATIPIALDSAYQQNLLKPGFKLLLTAVGAGLVSAAIVLEW